MTTTSRSPTAVCPTTSAGRSPSATASCSRRPRAWPGASRSTCGPGRRCCASTVTPRRSRYATRRWAVPIASPMTRSCCARAPNRSGPPIPGADDPRVDVLRNIPDMDRIIARLDQGASSAVVVGGSYIGLELTEAFRARGLQTTVVERTERLMPWLDPEMTHILDYHVEAQDVDLRLGTSAEAVRRTRGRPARAGPLRRHLGRGGRRGHGSRCPPERRPRPCRGARHRAARRHRRRRPHAHVGTGHPGGR